MHRICRLGESNDTQQLKLLAEPIHGLFHPSHPSLGHDQSLDLVAPLPGLRNWPESLGANWQQTAPCGSALLNRLPPDLRAFM